MANEIYNYRLIIQETMLDSFGHINNAVYLTLYEEARWDVITNNGYGIKKIREVGQGPTLLEIKLTFSKELYPRDEIIIESQCISYERKIGQFVQKMIRAGEVCSTLEMTFGLFDIVQRKLIMPTPEWLKAVGIKS